MAKTKKQKIGKWGEEQAALFLVENGYEVIERNFHTRQGEIDIIAWHEKEHFGRTLCFVEVKTRSYGVGSAERATGKGKLKKIFWAAKAYCLDQDIDTERIPIQFEQVSVYFNKSAGTAKLKLFEIPAS